MINRNVIEKVAAALVMLEVAGIENTSEGRLFIEVAKATLDEEPQSITHYSQKLGMPMSTISRVMYGMVVSGLLRYEPHPTDRRKKIVVADLTRM